MHQQLPVSHLGAGLWCHSRWWHTLCVDCEGEDVFMRPAAVKAPLRGPALNNRIVLGLLINVKGCWGTIPAVLSGANRGKQGALKLSRGPISRSICCLAAIPTTGPIVSGVGYVSVYLHVLVVPVLTAGMERIVFLCLPRDWKSLSLCT